MRSIIVAGCCVLFSLVLASCACGPFRTTTPMVTPMSSCLQIEVTTKRQQSNCAQVIMSGTNGCAVDLVFPAGSLSTTGGPVTVAAGASFSEYVRLPTDDNTYPLAYTVTASLGPDAIQIEFVVIDESN